MYLAKHRQIWQNVEKWQKGAKNSKNGKIFGKISQNLENAFVDSKMGIRLDVGKLENQTNQQTKMSQVQSNGARETIQKVQTHFSKQIQLY